MQVDGRAREGELLFFVLDYSAKKSFRGAVCFVVAPSASAATGAVSDQ